MEKKARIQFWMEFAVDAISLLIAYTLTVIFLNATTQKVDGMTVRQWLISYALMALSFLSSYAFFHSQIDIHTRNRFSELISTIKNGALTYLFFIVLAVFTKEFFFSSPSSFLRHLRSSDDTTSSAGSPTVTTEKTRE